MTRTVVKEEFVRSCSESRGRGMSTYSHSIER
jgi:hypothetical protein